MNPRCSECGLYELNDGSEETLYTCECEIEDMLCSVCGKESDLIYTARKPGDPQDGIQYCEACLTEWNPKTKQIGERQ